MTVSEYAPSMIFIVFLMARIGSGFWLSSLAIRRTMISESVVVRNAQPSDWSLLLTLSAFTMSPLCARATSPCIVVTTIGALFSVASCPGGRVADMADAALAPEVPRSRPG